MEKETLTMNRILGKRGRTTIPYPIRQRVGFSYNDVLSFTEGDDGQSVIIRKEDICCGCKEKPPLVEERNLQDVLADLTFEEQMAAFFFFDPASLRQADEVSNMAEHTELYLWSSKEARRSGKQDLWRESLAENCRCARAIEEAINANFDGKTLDTDCVRNIIDEFGFDRTNWVLANTVRQKKDDGRFAPDTKTWAKQTYIPPDDANRQFTVESHPAVLDGFISHARKLWQDLKLYDSSHCISERNSGIDYTGKVLVLHPSILKDEFKKPEFQLFLAISGYGCSPTATGRKVFGRFLYDDEETFYLRNDFIGIIKHDHLPQWAWDKIMPPIRSVLALPNQGALTITASTHWDAISRTLDCDTPVCDGMELNDGLVNVYHDPKGKEKGKPFNRRIGHREYYGAILINGMRSFDKPLSDDEAKLLIECLDDPEIMTEHPEQSEHSAESPKTEMAHT